MDFSQRLSRVAAIATWGGIVLATIGGLVLHHQHDPRLHFYAFLTWQGLAVLNALALSILPTMYQVSPHVRQRINAYRVALLLSTLVAVWRLIRFEKVPSRGRVLVTKTCANSSSKLRRSSRNA